MKKILNYAFLLMVLAVGFTTNSCSSGGEDDDGDSDQNVNPLNTAYVGTKWTANSLDYSFGDDWAGEHTSTVNVYFYSTTEGALYISNKDSYTDMGTSSNRKLYFFNYDVSSDGIYLNYITESPSNYGYLKISNGGLYLTQTELTKKNITSEDTKWLNQHKGTTGQCKWYHDFCNLFILGEGEMPNYSSSDKTPWHSLNYNNLIISNEITNIGDHAFENSSLAKVEGDGITATEYLDVTRIGKYAFANTILTSFHMPHSLVEIDEGAFSGCKYLTDIRLFDKLEEIGDYAFSNCPIKTSSFSLPSKVKSVGMWAFMGAKLGKLTLNEQLETIGTYAFTGVTGTLSIPNSVKSIAPLAFEGSFSKIIIGTGLTSLSTDAFCSDAKSGTMYLNLGNPLDVDDGIITNGSGFGDAESNWTLYVPKGSKSAYQKKSPWSKFKSIIEDATLESGNGTPDGSEDDSNGEEAKVYDQETYSYIIDGVEYKMILVEGNSTIPSFRIMQTELPPNSYFQVGNKFTGRLNQNMDEAVIKSEFRAFIDELRDATGTPFRLPTKAEWQFAARGGKTTTSNKYSGSNNIDDVAWYKDNSSNYAHTIATKKPNELGLYDMCGNYAEICNNGQGNSANEFDYNIDGYDCGGSYQDAASSCTIASYVQDPASGTIKGSKYKHKNAFMADHVTIRLVYTVPK